MTDTARFDPRTLTPDRDCEVSTYMSAEMHESVKKLAKTTGDSVSTFVRDAVATRISVLRGETSARNILDVAKLRDFHQAERKQKRWIETFNKRLDNYVANRTDADTEPELVDETLDGFAREVHDNYEAGVFGAEIRDRRLKMIERRRREYHQDYERRETRAEDHRPSQLFRDTHDAGEADKHTRNAAAALLRGNPAYARDFAQDAVDADAPKHLDVDDVLESAKMMAVEADPDTDLHDETPLLEQAAVRLRRGGSAADVIDEAVRIWPTADEDVDEIRAWLRERAYQRAEMPMPETEENENGGDEPDEPDQRTLLRGVIDRLESDGEQAARTYLADAPTAPPVDSTLADARRQYLAETVEEVGRYRDGVLDADDVREFVDPAALPESVSVDDVVERTVGADQDEQEQGEPATPANPGKGSETKPAVGATDGGSETDDD